MACPFDDEGAALLRRELNIRRERVIGPRIDVLAFPDNFLFERYRFTAQSINYIHNLIRPRICNITSRSHALTSQQILCVALHFFLPTEVFVLHNIATIRGEQPPALQIEDPDDDPIHLPAIQDGRAVRDTICQNHFRLSHHHHHHHSSQIKT